MAKFKIYLQHAYPYLKHGSTIALFAVGFYYQPIPSVIFAILFVFIALCFCLRIYFMSIDAKLAGIAKTKARHGIPLDQPHNVDRILKVGYFRIP